MLQTDNTAEVSNHGSNIMNYQHNNSWLVWQYAHSDGKYLQQFPMLHLKPNMFTGTVEMKQEYSSNEMV